MRGFSLIGLLVVVGIIFYLFTQNASNVAKVKKEVEPQAQRISGRDASGRPITETYSVTGQHDAGRFSGLKVTKLDADSPLHTDYGLQEGDLITGAGGEGGVMMTTKEADEETLKGQVASAYQFQQPLVIQRGGKTLTLDGKNKNGASAPADSVGNQLDKITKPR